MNRQVHPDRIEVPAMTSPSQTVWLLRNKVNPFPVKAALSLDGRTLTLALPAQTGETFHGWVAERLGRTTDDLAEEFAAGRTVTVFSTESFTIGWPKSFAGAAMEIEAGGATWLACLAHLSGGGLLQTMNLFTARGAAKVWKQALSDLGR